MSDEGHTAKKMARNDIRLKDNGPYSAVPTWEFSLIPATPISIKMGEPAKLTNNSGGTNPILFAAADPERGTDLVLGIAASDSTESATLAGVVQLYKPLPGIVWQCKALTAAAADTVGEINNLKGKKVTVDLTSSTFTIATAATYQSFNGLIIVGGDETNSTIFFEIAQTVTLHGSGISQGIMA